jgi:hypothetical protein
MTRPGEVTPGARLAAIAGDGPAEVVAATRIGDLTADGDMFKLAAVARMVREQADRLRERPEEIWEEILRRLRTGDVFSAGHVRASAVGPERSEEIPEEPAVRLVTVHPQVRHTRGDKARIVTENARTPKFDQYGFEDH